MANSKEQIIALSALEAFYCEETLLPPPDRNQLEQHQKQKRQVRWESTNEDDSSVSRPSQDSRNPTAKPGDVVLNTAIAGFLKFGNFQVVFVQLCEHVCFCDRPHRL